MVPLCIILLQRNVTMKSWINIRRKIVDLGNGRRLTELGGGRRGGGPVELATAALGERM